MVMDDHICPYGLTLKDLLERQGYEIKDNHLKRFAKRVHPMKVSRVSPYLRASGLR